MDPYSHTYTQLVELRNQQLCIIQDVGQGNYKITSVTLLSLVRILSLVLSHFSYRSAFSQSLIDNMVSISSFQWLVFANFLLTAIAHPGHDGTTELKMRKRYMATLQNRGLEQCTVKLKQNKVEEKIIARRQAMAAHIRKKRGLEHVEGLNSLWHTSTALITFRYSGKERQLG